MSTSRQRLGVIFLTVLIDLIGFGIVLPILPYYAQRFGAAGIGYGAIVAVFSGMQFVATAVLGKLSDRVGRRPILLTTMAINAIGYVLFAYAGSYWILFASRVISGFAGGNISAAQAYIADITSPAERSKGMGMLGAAFGIGFTLGPGLGGFADHYFGHAAPGLLAAGLSLANLWLAWVILPESLRPELRAKRRMWDFGHIGEALARPRLQPLLIVWALAPFAFAGYTVILPFLAAVRFNWGARELGVFFIVVGLTAAIVQGYVFGRLHARVGDRPLVITGMFGMAAGIGLVPFLPSEAALYGWTFVLAFSNSVFAPAATGLVSVYAGADEQGTVLGTAQAIAALGRTTGPLALGLAYDAIGGRTAFVAAGAVMFLAGIVSFGLERVSPHLATGPAMGDRSPPAGS